jgi:hypothetical protein
MIHSDIGASGYNRWKNCAGSTNLIALGKRQGTIEDSTSIYATEGTAAHEVAACCLLSGDNADTWIGETIEVDEIMVPFTRHMADAVQVYLDAIRNDMKQGQCFLEVETRFNLSVDPQAFGTNDALVIFPYDTLIIYDYKHGWTLVEVEDNLQLIYYAIGALEKYTDIEQVMMVIVQPRSEHIDGAVRRQVYTYDQLVKCKEQLIKDIAATRNPEASLKTGEWCTKNFCPAINVCPAVQIEVQQNAIVDFSNNPVLHPEVSELSIEQLLAVKNKATLITKFVASCIIALQKHAEAGVEIFGHKLVKSVKHRTWINKETAYSTLHRIYGTRCYDETLRPLTEIELMMKNDNKDELFRTLVKKPYGTPTLVPITDKRKAIVPTIFTDFEEEL